MDRDDAAARTEPSDDDPSSSHTALNVNPTSLYDTNDLYIGNSSAQAASFDLYRPPHLQSDLLQLQISDTPYADLDQTSSAQSWPTNAFELAANAAMSRQTTQANSKNSKKSPQYQLLSSESPADQARSLSQNNKDQLIGSLRTHKVNTITELRRIEKIFAYLDSEEVTEPMTAAWAHYVNSNNLLNELRGLTKTIPFSSECLDEAKALVVADPASVRSWNYCWLVLIKIEKENLIMKYARVLAGKRSTWGDRQPTGDDARKFITACVAEWTQALRQMLKHWDKPPSTTGN